MIIMYYVLYYLGMVSMRVAIGAAVVKEIKLFFLRPLYDNLAINEPPMSTLLHGAVAYRMELSRA